MAELTVTPDQRRAALQALGLDPDLTVSVSVASDWLTALVITTDDDGHPRVGDGTPITHSVSVPITAAESPAPEEDDRAV